MFFNNQITEKETISHMIDWGSFFTWQYLVFEVPFMIGMVLVFVQISGLLDLGHDADHDTMVHTDHDISGDHNTEHDTSSDESTASKALDILGVGKAPLSIIIISLCLLFGFIGWASLQIFSWFGPTWFMFWFALAVAAVCAVTFTAGLARIVGKFMPSTESYVAKAIELCGYEGVAIYPVTASLGAVRVRDRFGNIHEFQVRVAPGDPEIPSQTKVFLMEYDEDNHCFFVVPAVELLADVQQGRFSSAIRNSKKLDIDIGEE